LLTRRTWIAFAEFISKRDVRPLAQGGKLNFAGLADVPRLREADRKTGGNYLQNYNLRIVPDQGKKPKKKAGLELP
jgi:hypothetical protein